MKYEELQANRIKTVRSLSNLIKKAYTGLTCREYEALRCCRDYIETKYLEDKHSHMEANNDQV